MTTQIHDSTTCTLGPSGQPCWMCRFAAKSPAGAFQGYQEPSEGVKIAPTRPYAPETAISAPDFEHEWSTASPARRRYTEQAEAEHWFRRGLWAGIQYERERGLIAMNGDLREMQRIARERMAR